MARSEIDVVIDAIWQGRGAASQAERDLAGIENAADRAGRELEELSMIRPVANTGNLEQLGDNLTAADRASARLQERLGGLRERAQRADDSLKEMGTTGAKTRGSVVDLAGGIFIAERALTGAVDSARALWTALEEGAELELTQQRFDRLAMSIGTTGEALRGDIRTATGGMLTDLQAMGLATRLLGLDLANSADQAVRMGRVVTELDQDIGELQQALSNQTTRRFDQLNVSTEGFNERLERLKETMSDEEAFTMAFLQQAEEQIEKVGGASDTARGDLMRLHADWQALEDDFKLWLVGAAGPTLSFASGRQGTAIRETITGLAEEAGTVEDLTAAYEALAAVQDVIAGMNIMDRAAFVAAGGLAELDAAEEAIVRGLHNISTSAEDFQNNLQSVFGNREFIEAFNLQIASVSGVERVWQDLNRSEEVRQHYEDIEQMGEAYAATTETVERLNVALGAQIAADLRLAAAAGAVIDASKGKVDAYLQETAALRSLSDISEEVGARKLEGLELSQQRVDLFEDFQTDLTEINAREFERRTDLEEQYEERRTDLVAQYGLQRVQEEEDWQRRQAQQAARLDRDIASVQASSAERRARIQADAAERLEELEERHARDRERIIRDANDRMTDAVGNLDASALAQAQRDRDRALEDEQHAYEEQRDDIAETTDERLQAEREAEAARIEALRADYAERQRIDEENRAIQLRRQQEAHDRQLAELDAAHTEQLTELQEHSNILRGERTLQYENERAELDDQYDDLLGIAEQGQADILAAEEQWWADRLELVPTVSPSMGGGGTGGSVPASALPSFGPGVPASQVTGLSGVNIGSVTIQVTGGDSAAAMAQDIWVELRSLFEAA